MIVFENGSWQSNSLYPDTNFLENEDRVQPKWVVPDSSELAFKIKSACRWKAIEDESGQLVDIVIEEPPADYDQEIDELKSELEEIDRLAIRPLRAIAAGTDTEEDREVLADPENRANEIRERLAETEEKAAVLRLQEEAE